MEQRFEAISKWAKFHLGTETTTPDLGNKEMIMGVSLALNDSLSNIQLEKAQEFFLIWIKCEQAILREKLSHYQQYEMLMWPSCSLG